MKKKWYEAFGAEFTKYHEMGEAEAVHIVRDLAIDVDTTGQWIDVLSCNSDILTKKKEVTHEIKVELFKRMTKPAYTDNIEDPRYLCWVAAHFDICEHRAQGHHGPKYKVRCKTRLVEMESGSTAMEHTVLDSRRIK